MLNLSTQSTKSFCVTIKISEFGIKFLRLALRIDKHIKGYVDFYIGPKKLHKIVDNEVITSPNKLLTDCKALQKDLFKQGCDKKRERYLEKILRMMETSIEILNDIEIPIKEQFLTNFEIISKENLKNQLKRISNPVYSKNAFMYNLGSNLIKQKYGDPPSNKIFQILISNPLLSSDLI